MAWALALPPHASKLIKRDEVKIRMPVLLPTVPSPCIRHCTLNDEDVCVGCGRTLADITGWTKMSEQEKAACVERAQARLRDGRLQSEQPGFANQLSHQVRQVACWGLFPAQLKRSDDGLLA